MRFMRRFTVILFAAAACSPAADTGMASFSTTDSAGVVIVENGRTGTLPKAVLDSPRITLRIGEVDGPPELQFFRIFHLAQADNGDIHVADAGNREVRVFDAQGNFIRRYGRSGEGPGEFRFPYRVFLSGDTSIVLDAQLRRLAWFDGNGAVLSTLNLRNPNGELAPIGRLEHSWVVVPNQSRGWPYEPGRARRDTTRLIAVESLETALASLPQPVSPTEPPPLPDSMSGWRTVTHVVSGRRFGVNSSLAMTEAEPLFEPGPHYAVDAHRVHITGGDRYLIDSWDETGRLVRRLRRDYDAVPVTDEMVSRYARLVKTYWDTASMGGEAVLGKAHDEARIDLPHVDTLPPIGRMYASASGALWVERPDRVPDPLELVWDNTPWPPHATKWDLYDPDGRFLGMVTLPPRFSPLVAGEKWVLGILRDEMDVQYVARVEVQG